MKPSKIIYSLITVVWILGIVYLYFFTAPFISNLDSEKVTCPASASDSSTCVPWRPAHDYYHQAIAGSTALTPEGASPRANPVYGIMLAMVLLYGLFFLWRRYYKKEKQLELKVSPFLLVALLSGVFFITAFNWFSFYDLVNKEAPAGNIFQHYSFLMGQLLWISLVVMAFGGRLQKSLFKRLETSVPEGLIHFALGAVGLVFLLFLLGLFGQLTGLYMWILLGVLLLISWKEAWKIVKNFFNRKTVFVASYWGLEVLLFALALIVISHNLLELIRPMPIGFDDLGLYMNIPKLLATTGNLISGLDSYGWGLFMSLGFLLFNSTTLTLALSFLGGILVLVLIYFFIRHYMEVRGVERAYSKKYALLAAVLFYTLPTVVFQSAKDMKVDLAAMFFAISGLWLFWQFTQSLRQSKTTPGQLLFLSGLFLGFAFTVKYTALLLIVVLVVYFIFFLLRQRVQIRKSIGLLLLFGIACSLPFLPFAVKNVAETKQLSMESIRVGQSQAPALSTNPPLDNNLVVPVTFSKGAEEELGRYLGFGEGVWKYIFLPFTVTFHPITSGIYVDIGYVFLALLPIFFLLLMRPSKSKTDTTAALGSLTWIGILFWLLWGASAQGVIWYGYAGFIFLLVWTVETLNYLRGQKWKISHFVAETSIALWFICTLFLRSAYLPRQAIAPDLVGLSYARGLLDEQGYLNSKVSLYVEIMKVVNSDIKNNPANPPKVYRVGTFTKYFIDRNNLTVLDDNQLDVFAAISADHNAEKIVQRFQNSGFKYLVVDTNTTSIDHTPEKTLTAKYDRLIRFIRDNPRHVTILQEGSGVLFAQLQ